MGRRCFSTPTRTHALFAPSPLSRWDGMVLGCSTTRTWRCWLWDLSQLATSRITAIHTYEGFGSLACGLPFHWWSSRSQQFSYKAQNLGFWFQKPQLEWILESETLNVVYLDLRAVIQTQAGQCQAVLTLK